MYNKLNNISLFYYEYDKEKLEPRVPNVQSRNNSIEKKRNNKESGQHQFCGCIVSKDLDEYNTCPHLCEYCYANSSK
jgi:DNA repair photolyase